MDASSLEFLAIYQAITFGNERVETDQCEALQSTARHNKPVTQNESQIKLWFACGSFCYITFARYEQLLTTRWQDLSFYTCGWYSLH